MRKVILDTDILSEYLKGRDASVARSAGAYLQFHPAFTVTSITVYEIAYGLAVKGADIQLRKALQWLDHNEEIAPIKEDFRWAATARSSARRLGLVVELPDCLIAAVAVRLSLPLVTGNTADYQSIQRVGVALEFQNWRTS